MTHQIDYTLAEEIVEKGLDAIPELMRVLINNAMQVERAKYLQAREYERTENRKGHANGFKPKTVKTRMGEIPFAVPQVFAEPAAQIPKVLDNVARIQNFDSHRAGCWRNPEVSGPHWGMVFESTPRYCFRDEQQWPFWLQHTLIFWLQLNIFFMFQIVTLEE